MTISDSEHTYSVANYHVAQSANQRPIEISLPLTTKEGELLLECSSKFMLSKILSHMQYSYIQEI